MAKEKLPFQKINYIIMVVGVIIIALGFTIMAMETEPYGFGFLGLTLGPVVIILGFATQFIAILYKPKKDK